MSDPDFQAEEQPPPQPPRPTQPRNQVDADAVYARQLAEHYQSGFAQPPSGRGRGGPQTQQRRQDTGLKPNELYDDDDKEHSFFDGTSAPKQFR
jgi:hypothetical protein